MSRHSRQLRQRRIRGDKRPFPLPGIGEDEGLYYRCWVCGFRVKSDRDELGDEQSRSGIVHEDHHLTAFGARGNGDPHSVMSKLSGFSSFGRTMIALEIGADGTAKTIRHSHFVTGSGCPFCHSKNWR